MVFWPRDGYHCHGRFMNHISWPADFAWQSAVKNDSQSICSQSSIGKLQISFSCSSLNQSRHTTCNAPPNTVFLGAAGLHEFHRAEKKWSDSPISEMWQSPAKTTKKKKKRQNSHFCFHNIHFCWIWWTNNVASKCSAWWKQSFSYWQSKCPWMHHWGEL